MKQFTALYFFGIAWSLNAQSVELNLHHQFDGSDFAYGTNYFLDDGTAVKFDRVQYYLCGFNLTHDGGQSTVVNDSYILASANVTNYTIGNATVSTIEGISFDLGVDYNANHLGTGSWPGNHPLSAQSPSMDWGWPAGYFFFVIDGFVDNNGDGIPNEAFQLRGLGDALLRNVSFSGLTMSGNIVDMYVNIADWVKNLILENVGFDHSGSANNVQVADNTNAETVFTMQSNASASLEEITEENKVYANYTLEYAPTLFYDLITSRKVDLTIIDMNGRVVLESTDLDPEGNFFIKKELPSGSYVATFSNEEVEASCNFIVRR